MLAAIVIRLVFPLVLWLYAVRYMSLAEEVEARLNATLYFGQAGVIDFAILIILAASCAGLLIVMFDEDVLGGAPDKSPLPLRFVKGLMSAACAICYGYVIIQFSMMSLLLLIVSAAQAPLISRISDA
jgi:hypothetical protein